MSGLSSNALGFGSPTNKEKTFQGQRFDDELGLDWVQFKWRNHDLQIGRFIETDPLSEKYEYNSIYAFSENKVINHLELEGLEAVPINEKSTKPPLSGNTTTIKTTKEIDVINLYSGDKVTVGSFTAITTGQSGTILTTDQSTNTTLNNGLKTKIQGQSITLLSTIGVGYGTDGSVNGKIASNGFKGQVGVDLNRGVGLSFLASFSTNNGVEHGAQIKIKVGGLAAAVLTTALAPEVKVIEGASKLLKWIF